MENNKIMLIDDETDRTHHRTEGLLAAGYEVIVVAKSNIPTLQANIRLHKPGILMLDDDHVIHLDHSTDELDLTVIAA